MTMAANSMNFDCFSCCSTAVAGTSAHIIPHLDTAMILVVSICILPLLRIMEQFA